MKRPLRLASLALLLGACGIPSEGPTMAPGRNCQECHNQGDAEPSWTAAGTVFTNPGDPTSAGVQGIRISLTGDDGREVVVRSNRSGNFYTREDLAFPLRIARIEGAGVNRVMSHRVPHGACNLCHDLPGRAESGLPAPAGRIALVGGGSGDELMSPGDDCLACHDGRAAPRFTAAGTVYPSSGSAANQGIAGVTIRLRDGGGAIVKELVSNAVGNFFTSDPLPVTVRIEIQQGATVRGMEPSAQTPVDCNRCHAPGRETGRVAVTGGGGD